MTDKTDVVEQFKAMRAALESERESLFSHRKVLDERINEINSLLTNRPTVKNYQPNGTADSVRAMFVGNHTRAVTFDEIVQLLEGNRNRAGAAIQSLLKTKQLVRSSRGVYKASSKLIEKINGGSLPKE